jgi:hypothetical protein
VAPDSAARARLLALLQSEVAYDVDRMHAVPGLRVAVLFPALDQPLERQLYLDADPQDDARALLAPPVVTRVSAPLLAVQQAQQAVVSARPSLAEGAGDDDGDDDRAAAAALARRYAGALPRSGIDQLTLSTAADTALAGGLSGGARSRFGLLLTGALYDERLGDDRRFGFPGHTAMVVARTTAFISWAAGRSYPMLAAHDARLLGYRSLLPVLPESDGRTRRLGWELSVDARGNRAEALATEISGAWGLLTPLWERDELADHLLAGVGVTYQWRIPTTDSVHGDRPQGAGLPLALEFRRRLGPPDTHRSHLGARLFAQPTVIVAGAPVRAVWEAGAAFEAHLALRATAEGGASDPALLIAAQLHHESFSLVDRGRLTTALVSVGVERR